MNIKSVVVGAFEVNCYIIWRAGERRAWVIDPGAQAADIAAVLEAERLDVAAYLATHGHADHVNALSRLHARHPAPLAMHPADRTWAFDPVNQIAPFYDAPEATGGPDIELADGQVLDEAGLQLEVVATPGHSPGGVCFHCAAAKVLFSGDTLFQGSVGRTDLRGGDPRALARSLRRLTQLPDDTAVYPGHGPATRLGVEKQTNFFLRQGAKAVVQPS